MLSRPGVAGTSEHVAASGWGALESHAYLRDPLAQLPRESMPPHAACAWKHATHPGPGTEHANDL